MKRTSKKFSIDSIIQKHFPTVMVPKVRPLKKCEIGGVRFLMSEDGLYLDTKQQWGSLTRKLWEPPVPLPYGKVQQQDSLFAAVLECLRIVQTEMVDDIVSFAQQDLEWFASIGWENGRFFVMPTVFNASSAEVTYDRSSSSILSLLVADIHSHAKGVPYFSAKDDIDDSQGFKIAMVVGNCCSEGDTIPLLWRYCINGFVFETNEAFLWKRR